MDHRELKGNETELSSPAKPNIRPDSNKKSCAKDGKFEKSSSSSSSNASHVSRPVSSNCSYQETSLEIQSCKLGQAYAMDSSIKSDFKEGSLKLGTEVLGSYRARSSDDLSGMSSENNYAVDRVKKQDGKSADICKLDAALAAEASRSSFVSIGLSRASCVTETDALRRKKSSDCSRIDLNEDASEKENDLNFRITVSKPKPVMAKPGTPFFFLRSTSPNDGKPMICWRGSDANSAFRPASFAKNGFENIKLRAFECVDLNLDAVEEDEPVKARTLDFDLNCLGENEDKFCPISEQSVRDFDLNDNLLHVDTSNYPYSETGPRKQHEFRTIGPVYPPDLLHSQPFHLGYAPTLARSFRVDPKEGLVTQNLLRPGHVFHAPNGSSSSNFAIGNQDVQRGASSGQIRVPPTMEERMKRREPEGGWDSHQLRFMQMTSWQ